LSRVFGAGFSACPNAKQDPTAQDPALRDDALILDHAIVHYGTDAATMEALLTAGGRK
jgi:hypothetical protein